MSKKRGFFGKLMLFVVVLLVLAAAVAGYLFWTATGWVDEYTDTKPKPLPRVQRKHRPSRVAFRKARKELRRFEGALRKNKATAPLRLSAGQLNALLQRSPQLRGRVRLFIVNNQLKGHFRFPLQGVQQLKGRYFNGTARLRVKVKDGKLDVSIADAMVRGKPMPTMMRQLINQFGKREINKHLRRDAQAKRWLKRIKDVSVQGGRLVITSHPPK